MTPAPHHFRLQLHPGGPFLGLRRSSATILSHDPILSSSQCAEPSALLLRHRAPPGAPWDAGSTVGLCARGRGRRQPVAQSCQQAAGGVSSGCPRCTVPAARAGPAARPRKRVTALGPRCPEPLPLLVLLSLPAEAAAASSLRGPAVPQAARCPVRAPRYPPPACRPLRRLQASLVAFPTLPGGPRAWRPAGSGTSGFSGGATRSGKHFWIYIYYIYLFLTEGCFPRPPFKMKSEALKKKPLSH